MITLVSRTSSVASARLEGEGGPASGLMVRDAPQPPRGEQCLFYMLRRSSP